MDRSSLGKHQVAIEVISCIHAIPFDFFFFLPPTVAVPATVHKPVPLQGLLLTWPALCDEGKALGLACGE